MISFSLISWPDPSFLRLGFRVFLSSNLIENTSKKITSTLHECYAAYTVSSYLLVYGSALVKNGYSAKSLFIYRYQSSLRSKRLSNIGRAVLGNAGGARSTRVKLALLVFPYFSTAHPKFFILVGFLIFTPRALNYTSACLAG